MRTFLFIASISFYSVIELMFLVTLKQQENKRQALYLIFIFLLFIITDIILYIT